MVNCNLFKRGEKWPLIYKRAKILKKAGTLTRVIMGLGWDVAKKVFFWFWWWFCRN